MKQFIPTQYRHYSLIGIGGIIATALLINFLVIQDWSQAGAGHDHGHDHATIQGSDSLYPLVTVIRPSSTNDEIEKIEAAGQVLSKKQGQVFARRDGVVRRLQVDLGDTVYQGQILASLQSDRDDAAIAAEIGFKKRQLELARERALVKTDSHLAMVEVSIDTAKQEQDARLSQVDAQITGLEKELGQKAAQVETVAYDLLDSIAEALFTRTDGISNYYRHSSFDYYRRTQIYYGQGQETEVKAYEKDVIQLYKDLKAGTAQQDPDLLIERLVELGNRGRLYAQGYSDSPSLQDDQIDHIRKEIAETVDHIIDISLEFTEKESELAALSSGKDQILAETTRTIVSSQQERVEIEGERKDADIDAAEIEAEIAKLQQQLGASSTIYAPFSGVITKRHVSVGDSVNDDRPLFSLVDDTHKFVRFHITENDMPFIQESSVIEFSPTAAPSQIYPATIRRIAKAIDPVNRTILVEADIDHNDDDGRILTEMTVRALVPVSIEEGLIAIPEVALEVSGSKSQVFTVNAEAEVAAIEVQVAYVYGGTAYISEGITGSDWIIVKTPVALDEGQPVDTTL